MKTVRLERLGKPIPAGCMQDGVVHLRGFLSFTHSKSMGKIKE